VNIDLLIIPEEEGQEVERDVEADHVTDGDVGIVEIEVEGKYQVC